MADKRATFLAIGFLAMAPTVLASHVNAASPVPTSWEVGGEFNQTGGVGVWSYCSKTAYLALPCLLLGAQSTPSNPPMKGRQFSASQSLPLVSHNTQMTPQTFNPPGSTVTVGARSLAMHPGTTGRVAVVRFTAPYSATFQVSGQFYGIDGNGTGTHTKVYLVVNNAGAGSSAVYSGAIAVVPGATPTPSAASFTPTVVTLNAGDTLDFEVEAGANNNFNYGSTGLNAVIEKR